MTKVEKFQERIAALYQEDNAEVDELCIKWLKDMAEDHGDTGEHARVLLNLVADMLQIYTGD